MQATHAIVGLVDRGSILVGEGFKSNQFWGELVESKGHRYNHLLGKVNTPIYIILMYIYIVIYLYYITLYVYLIFHVYMFIYLFIYIYT